MDASAVMMPYDSGDWEVIDPGMPDNSGDWEVIDSSKPKRTETDPWYGVRSPLSNITLGLSEYVPGLSVDPEEHKFASPSDKLANFMSMLIPGEAAFRVVANPVGKKLAEWAIKRPYGAKALSAFGRLVGVGAAGTTLK